MSLWETLFINICKKPVLSLQHSQLTIYVHPSDLAITALSIWCIAIEPLILLPCTFILCLGRSTRKNSTFSINNNYQRHDRKVVFCLWTEININTLNSGKVFSQFHQRNVLHVRNRDNVPFFYRRKKNSTRSKIKLISTPQVISYFLNLRE